MKQEPVAWMREDGTLVFRDGLSFKVGQPFYTEPQYRELSKKDIDDACRYARLQYYEEKAIPIVNIGYATAMSLHDFAKAILKKASEK